MNKIKIVTDSTCDLPSQLVNENNIAVVPLKIHFGEQTYYEGIDLTPDTFYDKLKGAEVLPTTSQPSPGDFVKVYEEYAQQGFTHIISIHISSKLSGTYQSAFIAKGLVEDKIKVEVIDSHYVTLGLGLLVLEAAEMVKGGKSFEAAIQHVNFLREKVKLYFMVDTLEFLQKGGRIGKASSLIGSLLNIKPILTLIEGEVHPFEKVRGQSKALDRLVDIIEQLPSTGLEKVRCAIVHSQSLETAEKVKEILLNNLGLAEIEISEIGAVVGTHVGPGAIGIIIIK